MRVLTVDNFINKEVDTTEAARINEITLAPVRAMRIEAIAKLTPITQLYSLFLIVLPVVLYEFNNYLL